MKILIINNHPSDAFGGSEMQCDLIARGLTERGHEVIYGAVGKNHKEEYPGLLYTVVPLAIKKRGALSHMLQQEKPDVIYWRFNKNYLKKAVYDSNKEGVPFVFAVSHVNDTRKYPFINSTITSDLKSRIRSSALIAINQMKSRWNYGAFKHVDAVTLLNSEYFGRLPVKNQRVIWNSVTDTQEHFEWKRPFCVWIANIKPQKQPEIYLKLASITKEKLPNIDFLMIGAIQNEQYRSILHSAERMENFYYLGFQPPEIVNGVLKKAICLIHTCKPEGFGNNFIQAWMQGCPTISLEFDPDNLIQKEKLGFLSGTVEQMANDVELLVRNHKLRNEIGNRAQTFAYANFTPERMVLELESFLTEVISLKSG